MSDLLALTGELVDIPSVSHHETALADHIETGLRSAGHLTVDRYGDTVVARTTTGRSRRLLLAGHLDTVPPFGVGGHRLEGDTLSGLGAVDMKGGLAVLFDLARSNPEPAVDATFVFYTCEEVDRRHNGLHHLASEKPEVLAADAAVLAEPTGGVVEAGCQGTMRVEVTIAGRRAHTARPVGRCQRRAPPGPGPRALWRPTLRATSSSTAASSSSSSRPSVSRGGVAGNVVPDEAVITINLRFAPDRDIAAAETEIRRLLGRGPRSRRR